MNADGRLKMRLRVELGLALFVAGLFLLTLISREWIEALTGFDPDHHNGSFEWAIVATLFAMSSFLFVRARSDWRKVRACLTPPENPGRTSGRV